MSESTNAAVELVPMPPLPPEAEAFLADREAARAEAAGRVAAMDFGGGDDRTVYAVIQPSGEVGVVGAMDAGVLRTLAAEERVEIRGEKKPDPVPGLTALLAAAGLAGPGAMAALMPRPSKKQRAGGGSRFLRLEAPGGLSLKTPGRNSPCPCGCGKKAKRCPAGVAG